MSTLGPETEALASNAVSRKPRQGRSLASFDRMLTATKSLMLERGSEDFTLQDVSELGNVSIGSIYLRFESKDRLLHAVIASELQGLIAGEREMLEDLVKKSTNLEQFLKLYIQRYSSFLSDHARLLSTIMQRAALDPMVSGPGKETARRSASMAVEAMLNFQDEIQGDGPREKAETVFQVIFATIARQFGLGTTRESGDEQILRKLQSQLGKMTLAYLKYPD